MLSIERIDEVNKLSMTGFIIILGNGRASYTPKLFYPQPQPSDLNRGKLILDDESNGYMGLQLGCTYGLPLPFMRRAAQKG